MNKNLYPISVRDRLFLTGIHLFSAPNWKPPTVDDVVKVANLSRATFYNYFEDIESYVHFLVQESLSQLVREIEVWQEGVVDPLERIAVGVCVSIKHALSHKTEINLMSRFCLLQMSNESRISNKFGEDLLVAMLSGAVPETSLESIVCMVVGAISNMMFSVANQIDVPEAPAGSESLVYTLLRGLGVAEGICAATAYRSVQTVMA